MKKILFISLLCPLILFGQGINIKTSQNDDVILSIMQLSSQQLLDTADYYFNKNSYDTALIYYNFLSHKIAQSTDIKLQKYLLKVNNRMGNIYFMKSNYRLAYDLLIKSLVICDKYDFLAEKARAYLCIGVIYRYLNQYDIAKQYYLKALDFYYYVDSANVSPTILNNLGNIEKFRGELDSAFYYLNKSYELCKRNDDDQITATLNSLASYYQCIKQYDSAFYYFELSLDYAKKSHNINGLAINLSDIGKLYFELNKVDSALHYIGLSNKIASENTFLTVLKDNYLTLSEIDRSKGKFEDALDHYITYVNLKDSIYDAVVFSDINQMQRLYEVSITNQQIEELLTIQQIKENTIVYQKIIQRIISVIMLIMGIVMYVFFNQNKKLKKAYNVLVNKNMEIIELTKSPPPSPFEVDASHGPTKVVELEEKEVVNEESQVLDFENNIIEFQVSIEEEEMENEQFEANSEAAVNDTKLITSQPSPLIPDNESVIQSLDNPETINEAEFSSSEGQSSDIKSVEDTNEHQNIISETTTDASAPEESTVKIKKRTLTDEKYQELISKIMEVMENSSVFCNTEFSIDELAELTHSNQKYVSEAINYILNKNFRSFLNSYRIREAQRIFSKPETSKFTIESIAPLVGFKSAKTFHEAFKEITGVTPNFYIKSMKAPQEKKQ